MVDINFSSLDDTPKDKNGNYKDPDRHSKTLREYHIKLWSKNLQNGAFFGLSEYSQGRMHHKSELGEFIVSSDSIGHTYRSWSEMKSILNNISKDEIDSFLHLCTTVGGYIIFPALKVNNQFTINQSRGVNKRICDRWDLTLECIRLFYLKQESPLTKTLNNYSSFFKLFNDFEDYVKFFLMEDLVSNDFKSINFFLKHKSFELNPIPKSLDEYLEYKSNVTKFISSRNKRIEAYCKLN